MASLPGAGPADRSPRLATRNATRAFGGEQERIPGAFQLMLALYIIFTGTFPTIIQAFAFGVQSGAGSEFAAAMLTGFAFDLLLLLPVLLFSNHPLGILHPLLLALLLWPLLRDMPTVIQDWGGWAGILSGSMVKTPYFIGLPGRAASVVWTAIAKYNGIRILGLVCTYAGFWLLRGRPNLTRDTSGAREPASVRSIMIALIAISLLILAVFVRSRGGVNEHLTSLGAGRFTELSGVGAIIVLVDMGEIALLIWAAAKPGDVKSPLFLGALALITAAQFISNGSRGGSLQVPLTVGLIWALRTQRVPWKIGLLLVPVMFLSIGLLGAVRHASWYGTTASEALSSTTWTASFDQAQQEVEDRRAASAPVPVIERGFDLTGGLLLGSSYSAVVTSFVPRPLWPDKPRGVGQLYARYFLGASLSGTSIPVSPEAEMYWNFGLVGVVVLSMLYGALLRSVYYFYWRRSQSAFVTTFYLLFLMNFQFSSDRLVGLEQKTFLIILCYMVVAMLIPRVTFSGPLQRRAATPAPLTPRA